MQAKALPRRPGDGHLWLIAAGLSLFFNAGILAFAGLAVQELKRSTQVDTPQPLEQAPVATIYLEAPAENAAAVVRTSPSVPAPPLLEKRFARTSPDQSALPPEKPGFIGERNTRATRTAATMPAM